MTKALKLMVVSALSFAGCFAAVSARAQSAPSGAHPRIWLDAPTLAGIQAQAGVANGPVARGAARCSAAIADPASYATGGWQGFEFVTTLSGCLLSWEASGNTDHLAAAIKYWGVLLDDYQTVGDGLGGDTVVTHDTGYAMRTFAPFAALAYDWLHDAPGVTEALRARSRARFDAWVSYYSTSGYLRDMPDANYQAGYTFAATLIAIAEAGEAGALGDAHWATVRDTIWAQDMAPALAAGGVLAGGDWAEGWQYGPLSVLEYSLAARAMNDAGVTIPGIETWASSLPLRFTHGLTPMTKMSFTGGDSDNTTPYRAPVNGALLAAIAGPADPQAKSLARKLNSDLNLTNENPLFDALALAAQGPSADLASDSPTQYLASGAGNWYVRGSWDPQTVWGVFQCSRHVVSDHQYSNAGNWVLTRAADDLVVDPSPYGSLSTLTGNAPAIDSAVLPSGYSPSQGYWGESTGMRWWRQSASGIAAARCDYADQFRRSDVPSDVATALRDFVLIPHANGGTVVLVDRAVTGSPERGLHLRVRTPSELSLAGSVATSTLGESSLGINAIWSSSGTPSVRTMPHATECPSSDHACDVSRIASGTEYRVDVAGPAAFAIHVIDAESAGSLSTGVLLSDVGYRGVLVEGSPQSVAVITNDSPDGASGNSLVYQVAASEGMVHVVVDAPVDQNGKSDVAAIREGSNCRVEVTPYSGATDGFDGSPLILRLTRDCTIVDDGTQLPAAPDAGQGFGGGVEGAQDASTGQSTGQGTGQSTGQGGVSAVSDAAAPGVGSSAPANGGAHVGVAGQVSTTGNGTSTSLDAGVLGSSSETASASRDASGATPGCNLEPHRRFSQFAFAPLAASMLGFSLWRRRRSLRFERARYCLST
ncbi:MAG TPA: hypothetical protein VL137_07775 [Polyangiaceae bacterium]|nr:hypothetical protein [Polyangiaceae bacterium]